MGILNLSDNLPEQGKIKIGGKGEKRKTKDGKREYQIPEKWSYFQITKLQRGETGNFIVDHDLTERVCKEGDPDKPTKIGSCVFPFNEVELNFYTTYAYYVQSKRICKGNGEECVRINEVSGSDESHSCDPENCAHAQKNLCKPNGILSVIFPDSNVLGGVYKFRTTSWNSIISLISQLRMFRVLTGNHIAGVPFNLVLNSKQAMAEGQMRTIYFVTLEFEGGFEKLRLAGSLGISLPDAAAAKKQLMLDNAEIMTDPEEFAPEFRQIENKVVDAEGNIVDEVGDKPQGAGAFSEDQGEVPF